MTGLDPWIGSLGAGATGASRFLAWIAGADAAATGLRWLDLVGLSLVILFLVLGAMRGLWWQVVRLLGVAAVVAVSRAVAPRLAPGLQETFPGLAAPVASGIVWLAVLLAGLTAVALIGRAGKTGLAVAQLTWLDRAGGALAGAASGILLHAALLLVLCHFATQRFNESSVRGTRSARLLDAIGRGVPLLLDVHAAEALRGRAAGPPSAR